MEFSYIPVYKQNFRSMRRLDDERLGRVMKAYMDYAQDGLQPDDMDDAQFILFDALVDKFNRDAQTYMRIVERNKRNISKRWEKENTTGKSGNTTGKFGNTSSDSGIALVATKTITKTKTITEPKPEPKPSSSLAPFITDEQVAGIKRDRDEVFDKAQDAGFVLNNATMATLNDLCAEYTHASVKDALQQCVEQGVPKLAYLRKVLENKRSGKAKPAAVSSPARKVTEQQYDQREYKETGFEDVPDWLKERLKKG